jgi:hypothetical protein
MYSNSLKYLNSLNYSQVPRLLGKARKVILKRVKTPQLSSLNLNMILVCGLIGITCFSFEYIGVWNSKLNFMISNLKGR